VRRRSGLVEEKDRFHAVSAGLLVPPALVVLDEPLPSLQLCAVRCAASGVSPGNPKGKGGAMNSEGKKLQKELAGYLREKDRAALALLRARIKVARIDRGSMLRAARVSCRTARAELVERQRDERRTFVDRQRGERIAERSACAAGKDSARLTGGELEARARAEAKDAKTLQRQVRDADRRTAKTRSTARERGQEDDDAVRGNLPPELRPVFDKVRKTIKASGKRSRTEAFLDWAEENPEEILAVQQATADRELKELLKQQREQGRTVRDARRYKLPPEELSKLLAEVPF
jgi:hypothetical protein